MNSPVTHWLTHWCRSCGAHHPRHRIRQLIPMETAPDGEVELMTCPDCGSYEIEELQEVDHVQ